VSLRETVQLTPSTVVVPFTFSERVDPTRASVHVVHAKVNEPASVELVQV
jgi:hypothetical protein